MGFRMRTSFKLAPGVRMTVTPRGVGVSGGVRGARVSAHSSGRVTRTLGVPGTGVSHTSTLTSGRNTSAPRATTAPTPAAPTPGLFAPRWEKDLHKALVKNPDDLPALAVVGREHHQARALALLFEALRGAVPAGDLTRARDLVTEAYTSGLDPAADPFVTKYLPGVTATLEVADGVSAQLPLDRDTVGLLLAELHQRAGDRRTAIDVVEELTPSTIAAVSLAELYAEIGEWDQVIDLTESLANVDEAATFLLIQRGIALREQGYPTAAREALKEALRIRSRPAELRHRAWLERGATYLAEGKNSLARKDLERVLAENSAYPGLQEALAKLPA